MSISRVQPGSLKYGFAGITVKGVVGYTSIKFLNLSIMF